MNPYSRLLSRLLSSLFTESTMSPHALGFTGHPSPTLGPSLSASTLTLVRINMQYALHTKLCTMLYRLHTHEDCNEITAWLQFWVRSKVSISVIPVAGVTGVLGVLGVTGVLGVIESPGRTPVAPTAVSRVPLPMMQCCQWQSAPPPPPPQTGSTVVLPL